MSNRTIRAPGVELFEHDMSDYTTISEGTNCLLFGFAQKGVDLEPMNITNASSWLKYYGAPTNEAEEYFYNGAMEVLNQGGFLHAVKIPYTNDMASIYAAAKFKIEDCQDLLSRDADGVFYNLDGTENTEIDSQSTPGTVRFLNQYASLKELGLNSLSKIAPQGQDFLSFDLVEEYEAGESTPGSNVIYIIDKTRALYTRAVDVVDRQDNRDSRYCLGIIPVISTLCNTAYFQKASTGLKSDVPETYQPVRALKTITFPAGAASAAEYQPTRLTDDDLTRPIMQGTDSFSSSLAKTAATIAQSCLAKGNMVDGKFSPFVCNDIAVIVFKAYVSTEDSKIDFEPVESFVGSLDPNGRDAKGRTTYIGTIINNNSEYIEFFANVDKPKTLLKADHGFVVGSNSDWDDVEDKIKNDPEYLAAGEFGSYIAEMLGFKADAEIQNPLLAFYNQNEKETICTLDELQYGTLDFEFGELLPDPNFVNPAYGSRIWGHPALDEIMTQYDAYSETNGLNYYWEYDVFLIGDEPPNGEISSSETDSIGAYINVNGEQVTPSGKPFKDNGTAIYKHISEWFNNYRFRADGTLLVKEPSVEYTMSRYINEFETTDELATFTPAMWNEQFLFTEEPNGETAEEAEDHIDHSDAIKFTSPVDGKPVYVKPGTLRFAYEFIATDEGEAGNRPRYLVSIDGLEHTITAADGVTFTVYKEAKEAWTASGKKVQLVEFAKKLVVENMTSRRWRGKIDFHLNSPAVVAETEEVPQEFIDKMGLEIGSAAKREAKIVTGYHRVDDDGEKSTYSINDYSYDFGFYLKCEVPDLLTRGPDGVVPIQAGNHYYNGYPMIENTIEDTFPHTEAEIDAVNAAKAETGNENFKFRWMGKTWRTAIMAKDGSIEKLIDKPYWQPTSTYQNATIEKFTDANGKVGMKLVPGQVIEGSYGLPRYLTDEKLYQLSIFNSTDYLRAIMDWDNLLGAEAKQYLINGDKMGAMEWGMDWDAETCTNAYDDGQDISNGWYGKAKKLSVQRLIQNSIEKTAAFKVYLRKMKKAQIQIDKLDDNFANAIIKGNSKDAKASGNYIAETYIKDLYNSLASQGYLDHISVKKIELTDEELETGIINDDASSVFTKDIDSKLDDIVNSIAYTKGMKGSNSISNRDIIERLSARRLNDSRIPEMYAKCKLWLQNQFWLAKKDMLQYIAETMEDCIMAQDRYLQTQHAVDDANVILGFYPEMAEPIITYTEIAQSLNKTFETLGDPHTSTIDVVCDAGLSNIAQFVKQVYDPSSDDGMDVGGLYEPVRNSGYFKFNKYTDLTYWKTIIFKFDTFCREIRKDCMFIADSPRHMVLIGNKQVVRKSKKDTSVDLNILPYLTMITGFNTSYGAGYLNWYRTVSDYTGDTLWLPPSIKAMGTYILTDKNYNWWDAPAGMRRGVINMVETSFNPTQTQAGEIYDVNWNYAIHYQNDGIIQEGQKTFQTRASAFDRINVRRLFLRCERYVHFALHQFLYEAHTAKLRKNVVATLTPFFEDLKQRGGMYNYIIICDETNNTPEVIDRNELKVKIGIQPVKTIEFILVDFVASKTGSDWSELASI